MSEKSPQHKGRFFLGLVCPVAAAFACYIPVSIPYPDRLGVPLVSFCIGATFLVAIVIAIVSLVIGVSDWDQTQS